MKQLSLLATLLVMFYYSFGQTTEENRTVLETVTQSLNDDSRTIRQNSLYTLVKLEDATKQQNIKEKEIACHESAKKINALSDDMAEYIQRLRKHLRKESGHDRLYENELTDAPEAVVRVFHEQKWGQLLQVKLDSFYNAFVSLDPKVSSYLTPYYFTGYGDKKKKFVDTHFKGTVFSALLVLAKLENDVRKVESKAMSSCLESLSSPILVFDTYQPIIVQDSKVVPAGEPVRITVGVGAFSRAAKPSININGEWIPVNSQGIAVYKTSASTDPGHKTVPVRVTYVDEKGKENIVTSEIRFEVKAK